ncbi:MAG: hypothetical protein IKJ85_00745, partial [Firmicutes bacterium]|nr:hypothetical protein [Bacillota bacterium]
EISADNEDSITIKEVGLYIKSAGSYCGSTSSIEIDGIEYASDKYGLNVVVYDQANNCVIDKFNY